MAGMDFFHEVTIHTLLHLKYIRLVFMRSSQLQFKCIRLVFVRSSLPCIIIGVQIETTIFLRFLKKV